MHYLSSFLIDLLSSLPTSTNHLGGKGRCCIPIPSSISHLLRLPIKNFQLIGEGLPNVEIMCKHVDHEVQVGGKLIAEFSLEKGEGLECAFVLDSSQHMDVCNVNNLEAL